MFFQYIVNLFKIKLSTINKVVIQMTLIKRDLSHIWHPCSQMKDCEKWPLLEIRRAYGSYLELADGTRLIDAISSWWCKSLGHGQPRLKAALLRQVDQYEHVILANTCQETLVELSEKLALLCPQLNKIFYASEGASAVEIAVKMSLHSRQILGKQDQKKNRIMALQNAYHGETLLTLSLSDVGIYKKPYQNWLMPVIFLQDIPYVCSEADPLWQDCGPAWINIENQLNEHIDDLSAIIVEPIVQGAGGMLIYSQDFLKKLRAWTLKQDIHLICDEIMTGLGRTGFLLACEHAEIVPDFICLGKGLTSGWLPMSAVLTTKDIYQLFYDDYETGKSFLHSHTFSGNALAAAVALETLKMMEEEKVCEKVREKQALLNQLMLDVARKTQRLTRVRCIGAIVAADLILEDHQKHQRVGDEVFQNAIKLGAFLRPLGNTLYWLPPLNIENEILHELKDISVQAINKTFRI